MNTAVTDKILLRNPCKIKGAGREESPERPYITAPEMMALAGSVPERHRLLVLLGGQTGLRLGELLALRRRNVDVLHRCLLASESAIQVKGVPAATKTPKSAAGIRKVFLAPALLKEIENHLDQFVLADPDAHLFTGVRGGRLRPATWWEEFDTARKATGLTQYVFHDSRHRAGTSVAQAGATTKETMRRLGHSTPAASLRYQHATDERDALLAEALAARTAEELAADEEAQDEPRDGRAIGGESSA